jgi:hypothetical protein
VLVADVAGEHVDELDARVAEMGIGHRALGVIRYGSTLIASPSEWPNRS